MTDPGPPAAPTIAAFQEFSSFSAQISRGLGPSDSCCAQMFLTQALRIHRLTTELPGIVIAMVLLL